MSCVSVIPARGGSKGILRKNLQTVGGIPLVVRAISACKASERIADVYVSTDDPEIAALSSAHGAGVIERPADLSVDTASTEAALLHALDWLAERGQSVETLVCIQCTSPFIYAQDLDRLVDLVDSGAADSAFTAARSHRFLWKSDADGQMVGINHDSSRRLRRQDLEPEFVETGAAYAFNAAGFRQARNRFFGRIRAQIVPERQSMEIDDASDLALANRLADQEKTGLTVSLPSPVDAVVLDFDGVLTDDRVFCDETGRESVVCSRADGLGLERLARADIPVCIISKEKNTVVSARARKLNVPVHQGIEDKASLLTALARDSGWSLERIIYVGNDINDLPAMKLVGLSVAPCDARAEVLSQAHWVLSKPGGRGAVRELADVLISEKNR